MASVARGTIRLRSAPACDPPYDDERPVDWWGAAPAQEPLALAAPPASERRGAAPAPRGLPPAPATSPDVKIAVNRFVNTCLEVLNGYRPVAHLRPLSRPLEAATVLSAMTHAARQLQPVVRRSGQQLQRRAVRTCQPRPDVAEVAVVIGTSLARRRPGTPGTDRRDRSWGLAYRLERRSGSWQCTAAQLL